MNHKAQDLEGHKNIATFQFADAVSTLLTSKYNESCAKFSLRDKAHIRKMVEGLNKKTNDAISEIKTLKKKAKKMENAAATVISIDDQNRSLIDTLTGLNREEANLGVKIREFEEKRNRQKLELQGLKGELQELRDHRQKKEGFIISKYGEAVEIMASKKDSLKKEIESLHVHIRANQNSKLLQIKASEQQLLSSIEETKHESEEIDMKLEGIKINFENFLKKNKSRYDSLRLDWEKYSHMKNLLVLKKEKLDKEKTSIEETKSKLREEIDNIKRSLKRNEIKQSLRPTKVILL